MAWYTCSIGSHTFSAYPDILIETEPVIRTNVTPNRLVARYYRWLVRGRIVAGTPSATATALLTFLTACVNPTSGVLPTTFKILDATATAVAQIGNVVTGTAEEWEDLQVTSFRLLDQEGSLVADAQFEVGFSARRSFPDSNGICELVQEWTETTDDNGNTVRNLTTTEIRLAKSSANLIASTAAITAQLTITKPPGWSRTKGSTSRGFTLEYLEYPLLHRARCESEVVSNAGGATPPSGANSATTTDRIVDDAEKGVRRHLYSAESVGSVDGLTWVEDQRPADATGETESGAETKTYRGRWQYLEALAAPPVGKVTRTKRTFQLNGGGLEGGAIRMSPPYLPLVSRGARAESRLVETVRVYALGVTNYADIPLPDPLPGPWLLVEPTLGGEPSVDEDSRYPAQRLWVRSAVREYLWGGAGDDPRADAALAAAAVADATVSL